MKSLIYILLMCVIVTACKDEDNGNGSGEITFSDFKDVRDGIVYKCITIGRDTWMAENLRFRIPGGYYSGCYRYSEGWGGMNQKQFDTYLEEIHDTGRMTDELYTECYDMREEGYTPSVLMGMIGYKFPEVLLDELLSYDETYVEDYGYLYTYPALEEAVPEGWRLPTDEDWKRLEEHTGVAAGALDNLETWRGEGIAEALLSGERGIGFNVKYGGGKVYHSDQRGGTYDGKGVRATFWTSDSVNSGNEGTLEIIRTLELRNPGIWRGTTKRTGTAFSVRCIRK